MLLSGRVELGAYYVNDAVSKVGINHLFLAAVHVLVPGLHVDVGGEQRAQVYHKFLSQEKASENLCQVYHQVRKAGDGITSIHLGLYLGKIQL